LHELRESCGIERRVSETQVHNVSRGAGGARAGEDLRRRGMSQDDRPQPGAGRHNSSPKETNRAMASDIETNPSDACARDFAVRRACTLMRSRY
jgi:hypothetical protein